MAVGVVEDTEVEVMVVVVDMELVAKEDVMEGAMIITHTNLPAGMEHLRQRPIYTLQTNGGSSPRKKILIIKK